MPRARKKKVTISASGAEHCARTRSWTKRRREEKDGEDPGMGGADRNPDGPGTSQNPEIYDQGTTHSCFSPFDKPRARKKKVTISASGAEHCARTRSGTKRRREEKDGEDPGMGGAVSSQEENRNSPESLQTAVKGCSAQPPPLPEKPDYSRMCSKCYSFLKPAVVPAGQITSLLQCPRCTTTRPCEHCWYLCPEGTCTNQSCKVVSLLLTCDQVTESKSKVYGCPVFRACPKCHDVMMHETGCKYVSCAQCRHTYCFICLRTRQECVKDRDMYWSLTCSAPKAARQRFQT